MFKGLGAEYRGTDLIIPEIVTYEKMFVQWFQLEEKLCRMRRS